MAGREGVAPTPQADMPNPANQAKARLRAWVAVWRHIADRTFIPPWLPDRWQHPATGYLTAIVLQGLALIVVILLAEVLVGFAFPSLLSTLAVACVALAWGLGPSLLGTFAGLILLTALLLSPVLHLNERPVGRVVALVLYVAVGAGLGGLSSQVVRGRRDAQERARRDKTVPLTSTAYRLLEELIRHAGRTLPHDYLLTQVWGPEYRSEDHYLKIFVRRLRRKLGDDAHHPRYLQTDWGVGYRFTPSR